MAGEPDFSRHSIESLVRHTGRVSLEDLDWDGAQRAGLTEDEVFLLTYFTDIENQTLRYLRMLLSMRGSLEPEMAAFLTTWNYEEFFHGYALERLLSVTGHGLPSARREQVSEGASWRERFEWLAAPLLSRLFADEFPAAYMTFGASHELTTLRAYERIRRITHNPVLRELSARIARQERRHFAFYFNRARMLLARSRRAQRLTRTLLRFHWTPVGTGVKSRAEFTRLYHILFPGELGPAICAELDQKIASLPGLSGIRLMQDYFGIPDRAARRPAWHRAAVRPAVRASEGPLHHGAR